MVLQWPHLHPELDTRWLPREVRGLLPFDPEQRADAAIALIFCPPPADAAEAHIIFTKRTTIVKTHKGQVGLPGGHVESFDGDLRATALRETEEEIGIAASQIWVAGCLPMVFTPDLKRVLPIVATTTVQPGDMVASADEVAEIVTLPWTKCREGEAFEFVMFGKARQTPVFDALGVKVWGLTAKVLESAGLN